MLLPSPFGRGAGGEGVGGPGSQATTAVSLPALTLALSRRERGPWWLNLQKSRDKIKTCGLRSQAFRRGSTRNQPITWRIADEPVQSSKVPEGGGGGRHGGRGPLAPHARPAGRALAQLETGHRRHRRGQPGQAAVNAACGERLLAMVDVDESHLGQAQAVHRPAASRNQDRRHPGVLRLPQDVRQDPQGHRRRVHRHAGPSPRRGLA